MAEIIPSGQAIRKAATASMATDDSDRDRTPADPEVDWFFANASPNPARVGCLSEDELGLLARRSRPISDAGYEHLAHCSPCYQQFRRLQAQSSLSGSSLKATRRVVAIAAAVAMMAGAGGLYLWSTHTDGGAGAVVSSGRTNAVAVLDLRGFLVTRGTVPDGREPFKLSRHDAELKILLPVGFEPGDYELRLIDAGLAVAVLDDKAAAVFQDQTVAIRTSVSLGRMQPGRYRLALRRSGEDWHFFPTILE
ncbi:MAG: hypothetical protein K1X67_20715 [Fimbriimonadaceae bacterium]|jgi:hypothetical protein|nr:hypothetical protein [Fimbriimonadaceae bacterium]